jgi:hypothetical protein
MFHDKVGPPSARLAKRREGCRFRLLDEHLSHLESFRQRGSIILLLSCIAIEACSMTVAHTLHCKLIS